MKNTYFLLNSLLVLACLVGCSANFVQAQDNWRTKGTETSKFDQQTDTNKCFVFNQYIVKTKTSEDVGEDITVYKRPDNLVATNGCKSKLNLFLSIKNPDANYFVGLSGDYLFIDSGTGASSRGLEIYNLRTKKSIFMGEYHELLELLPDEIVLFDSVSEKSGVLKTCKQAAQIKRDGMSVGWVQNTKLDLKTLKKTSVGALRCVALE